ncbi:MAG: hypothetical protein R3B58_07730 [Phycisphaerales bacterium]|nr:hypothetical protein [Phycisphaerales bacterium]
METMHAVIFIGIQASGKSTFFHDRFARTHIRVNLDMLRTRHREKKLIETCLDIQQPFVIDNTNPTKEDRLRYIPLIKASSVPVAGYYFQSQIGECLARNNTRHEQDRIDQRGVLATHAKLELPSYDEGFDTLFYVKMVENGFSVEEWQR